MSSIFYFINNKGVIIGIPFDKCNSKLKEAKKLAQKELPNCEYMGLSTEGYINEWNSVFFSETK